MIIDPYRYAGSDPYFSNVVALLHCDVTPFVDSSSYNRTLVSSASLQTTIKVFGAGSLQLSAGNGGLQIPYAPSLEVAALDFTLESRVYFTVTSGARIVLSKHSAGATGPFMVYQNGTSLEFYASSNGTTWNQASALSIGTVATGNWYGWAVSRIGDNIYTHFGGTYVTTVATSASAVLVANSDQITVGDETTGATGMFGYQDEVRITIGTGRYGPTNYTLDVAAFPDS